MEARLERNYPTLSPEQQSRLAGAKVAVVGCGGLGGWLCEYLLRLGVGTLRVIDADRFAPNNGNRQLYCTAETLGERKAEAVERRAARIAPEARVEAVCEALTAENADALLADVDLVLDALDSVPARLALEDACARLGLRIIHGAVCGWSCQTAVVPPGSGMLRQLYGAGGGAGGSTLSFVPAACAARQAAEAAKLLLGLPSALEGKLLCADLRSGEETLLELA